MGFIKSRLYAQISINKYRLHFSSLFAIVCLPQQNSNLLDFVFDTSLPFPGSEINITNKWYAKNNVDCNNTKQQIPNEN